MTKTVRDPEPPEALGEPEVPVGAGHRLPSLGRGSAARFIAEGSGVFFGLLAGVMTARWLGPHGKGLLASLTVTAVLVAHVCTVGLGDAAIVNVGRDRASLQRAFSATAGASMVLAVLGMALLWSVGSLWFANDWGQVQSAVLVASLGLPLYLWARLLSFMLNAQERVGAGSAVVGIQSAVMAVGVLFLVGVVPLGITGGALAHLIGAASALALGLWLNRAQVRFRPRWDWSYLRPALRYGALVETSNLMTFGFLRGDLLLVYALAGSVAAGHYSVALTGGILVGMLPLAVSMATFPRIAKLSEPKANKLIAQVCRTSLVAGAGPALVLIVAAPVALPLLFGRDFQASVPPALILIAGGFIWSTQWILCRAQAARGRPGLQLRAFSLSLAAMVALDLVLIPQLGINGAAIAAVTSPLSGLLVTLYTYRRADWWGLPLTRLVPTIADVQLVVKRVRRLILPSRPTSTPDHP